MLRILTILAGLVALLLALGAGALVWLGKRAEPVYDGELAVAGIEAAVSVRYGRHAVPSIEADSLDDMLFAQGYVLASERLWQMDLLRRLAGGRLAEVFGEAALPADRFYRTVGLPLAAREAYAALEPEYRRMLERYADGVNAYRRAALERPPLEYLIAGFDPAPWTPEDSLVIGEYMAWINSVNLREELVFLRLAGRLGNPLALELFPVDVAIPASAGAAQLPDYRALMAGPSAPSVPARLVAAGPVVAAPAPGVGASNVWAVNGPRADQGQALLANDPHLAPSVPGIWYELELRAPGYHAAGVALPGVPLVLIGHNEHLAWGMTTVTADTQDLFLERPIDEGQRVLRPNGGSEVIARRLESIPVKGRAEPVQLEIERTSNGVLIDDLIAARGANPEGLPAVRLRERVALRRNLEVPDRALVGLWRLNTATTVDEARAAGVELRHVSQNLVIAHRNGGIGWQVTGMLPLRGRGSGQFPSLGWEAGYGWSGYLPFARNPGVTNPDSHQLVNANNRSVPEDSSVNLGHSWLPPYRALRIEELLDSETLSDADALARMQADRESVRARVFMASLRRSMPELRALDPEAARIAERELLSWRGDFSPNSHAAALYGLLLPALYQALYGDELGDDLRLLMSMDFNTYGPLDEALRTDHSSFWDDIGTPLENEGPGAVWARAIRAADARLQALLPQGDEQRLDRLRTLTFPHAFDGQPVIGDLFSVGPIPMGGDSATVNVANATPTVPREIGYIPSVRVVYTPADWSGTRGTLPLGQSGHRLSRYRTDQLDDWLACEGHAWPWNGPPAGAEIGQLQLVPEG
jgi:penicillin amidase